MKAWFQRQDIITAVVIGYEIVYRIASHVTNADSKGSIHQVIVIPLVQWRWPVRDLTGTVGQRIGICRIVCFGLNGGYTVRPEVQVYRLARLHLMAYQPHMAQMDLDGTTTVFEGKTGVL